MAQRGGPTAGPDPKRVPQLTKQPERIKSWEFTDESGSRWGALKPTYFGFRYGIYKKDKDDTIKESKMGFEIRDNCGETAPFWAEKIATILQTVESGDPVIDVNNDWASPKLSDLQNYIKKRKVGNFEKFASLMSVKKTEFKTAAKKLAKILKEYDKDNVNRNLDRASFCYSTGIELTPKPKFDETVWHNYYGQKFIERVDDIERIRSAILTALNAAEEYLAKKICELGKIDVKTKDCKRIPSALKAFKLKDGTLFKNSQLGDEAAAAIQAGEAAVSAKTNPGKAIAEEYVDLWVTKVAGGNLWLKYLDGWTTSADKLYYHTKMDAVWHAVVKPMCESMIANKKGQKTNPILLKAQKKSNPI